MTVRLKPYEETHFNGVVQIENELESKDGKNVHWGTCVHCGSGIIIHPSMETGDIGIKIESDGRFWVCVNGRAFIRAKAMDVSVMQHQDRKLIDPPRKK